MYIKYLHRLINNKGYVQTSQSRDDGVTKNVSDTKVPHRSLSSLFRGNR